jgi:hypothetical protein
MHFCSKGCRTVFAKNVTKSIIELEIPEQ